MNLGASGAVSVELKVGQVLVLHPQAPKPEYNAHWAGAGMRFI